MKIIQHDDELSEKYESAKKYVNEKDIFIDIETTGFSKNSAGYISSLFALYVTGLFTLSSSYLTARMMKKISLQAPLISSLILKI